jgi:hypothetical protein
MAWLKYADDITVKNALAFLYEAGIMDGNNWNQDEHEGYRMISNFIVIKTQEYFYS